MIYIQKELIVSILWFIWYSATGLSIGCLIILIWIMLKIAGTKLPEFTGLRIWSVLVINMVIFDLIVYIGPNFVQIV